MNLNQDQDRPNDIESNKGPETNRRDAVNLSGESLPKPELPKEKLAKEQTGTADTTKGEEPQTSLDKEVSPRQAKVSLRKDEATNPTPEKKRGFNPHEYKDPYPKAALIRMLEPLNRWLNLKGLPILRHAAKLIRAIPYSNRIPGVRTLNRALGGLLQFQRVDFPKEDVEKMKAVVNKNTAAFMGPSHPEFYTDWMIDKEVCSRVSPLTANWATYTIVNGNKYTQPFWLANNLVSNVSGGGGKDYSQEWAKKGNGVLLHPEGTVHWTGRHVGAIFPGIVDMAVDTAKELAAEGSNRPVYIVPFVSRHNFTRDVSYELCKEMKWMERKLGVASGKGQAVEARFHNLQNNILERQIERFGYVEPAALKGADFFARQDAFYLELKGGMEALFGSSTGDELKQIYRFEKANKELKETDPETYSKNKKTIAELRRLQGFTAEVYGGPTISQEDIAESLKRIQKELITKGFFDGIRNMIPLPVAERDAHIRSAEPIRVDEILRERPEDEAAIRQELWEAVGRSLQDRLDELNDELEPVISKFEKDNPFIS